ncbi:exodeoxyribonuclease VII small subunit [bacterium]|nr:exodeoxyribonuclease VII small subunit [bacterium]
MPKNDATPQDIKSTKSTAGSAKPSDPIAPTGLSAPDTGELRFEDAFSRLEELVNAMERGDLPLEELLARFEEGVGLVKHCSAFLKQAQLRIEQYVEQKDGQWVLKEMQD